jgi:hypothetical protein
MADNKPTNKERLAEITAGIEQGIGELFQSDRYAQYLATMSRFHKYSVNNQMLIYQQKPDATLVAGFNKWRDQFERHVKKGEKAIHIIAPTPFKKKIEMEKLDPDTQRPMLNPMAQYCGGAGSQNPHVQAGAGVRCRADLRKAHPQPRR